MRIALGSIVVAATAFACGQAAPLSEADKSAIRAVSDSFVRYATAGNDSGLAALYTEHATLMPPNQGIVEGRAAIRARFDAFPPMAEMTLTPIDVDGRGDIAYVRGNYVVTAAGPEGTPAVPDRGKYVEIWRREGGREWRLALDIFNSDMPAPAALPQTQTPRGGTPRR